MVIRTKFLDNVLSWCEEELHFQQVVIVAAGMDTRRFRIASEKIIIYELDFPQVLEYKANRLPEIKEYPTDQYKLIGVDFRENNWHNKLLEANYNPEKASLWIIEGLFVYLTDEQINGLLEKVNELTRPGCIIAGDWMNRSYIESKITKEFRDVFDSFHSPFINGRDHDEFNSLFYEKTGFLTQLYALGEDCSNFNRVPEGQVKVANEFPIENSSYQYIPRHFLFIGEKQTQGVKAYSDAFLSKYKAKTPTGDLLSHPDNKPQELKFEKQEVIEKLIQFANEILNNAEHTIHLGSSLYSAGFDSFSVLLLANKIEEHICINPPSTLAWLFSCDSIQDIANELCK